MEFCKIKNMEPNSSTLNSPTNTGTHPLIINTSGNSIVRPPTRTGGTTIISSSGAFGSNASGATMMMMASRKIIFSPHKLDLFLVGGYGINDLRLYQARSSDHNNTFSNTLFYDQVATPLRFVDIPLTVKTFDWSRHSQYVDLIGLGLTNGKTILLRMGFDSPSSIDDRQDEKSMILGEIVPRQARPCNVVQFNAWNPSQILVGLDKVRNDYCLFVHDIGQAAGLVTSKSPLLFQFGSSETIDSAIFFNHGSRIVAGMGSKWIRLYDLKRNSTNAPSIVFGTRSVLGVEADPFDDNYFLSHAEDSIVNIWDIRNNKGPCLVLETDFRSAIRTVTYNPYISGLLAVCGENERGIKLFHLKGKTDNDGLMLWKTNQILRPNSNQLQQEIVATCAWIPSQTRSLISLSYSTILPSHTSSLSAASSPMFSVVAYNEFLRFSQSTRNSIVLVDNQAEAMEFSDYAKDDINFRMLQMALMGYSADDIDLNLQLCPTDELRDLWEWVKFAITKKMQEKAIHGMLHFVQKMQNSDILNESAYLIFGRLPCYSEERWELLEFLGPHHELVSSSDSDDLVFKHICYKGVEASIKFLESQVPVLQGPFPILRALLSCPADSLTTDLLFSLSTQFPVNSKLYHLLILVSGQKSLSSVICDIVDKDVKSLFAILFAKTLDEMVDLLRQQQLETPSMYGLRIFGFSDQRFVQRLVDESMIDIQTLCLSCKALTKPFPEGKMMAIDVRFVEIYRDYLDHLQLFAERAKFDRDLFMKMESSVVAMGSSSLGNNMRLLDSSFYVALNCNYCGKELFSGTISTSSTSSISGNNGGSHSHSSSITPNAGSSNTHATTSTTRRTSSLNTKMGKGNSAITTKALHFSSASAGAAVANAVIPKSCQHCQKPLPRCAVCQMYLMSSQPSYPVPTSRLITWCLKCGHGGHSSHIESWFQSFSECPVSDCSCKCSFL